jgi:hypothetical protein
MDSQATVELPRQRLSCSAIPDGRISLCPFYPNILWFLIILSTQADTPQFLTGGYLILG